MAITTVLEQVEALYVGYFGRAGEPDGAQYWVDQIQNHGLTWAQAAASFSVQPESTGQYPFLAHPDLADPLAFINQVYQNLFHRDADPEGQAYWAGVLASDSSPDSIGQFILNVINGAYNPDAADPVQAAKDAAALDNKIDAAEHFTLALTEAGIGGTHVDSLGNHVLDNNLVTPAHDAINSVTDDPATVVASNAATDAFVEGVGHAGDTFTLTTGVDGLPDFLGTPNNDTYNAAANGGNATLTALDHLDGADGNDTLNVVSPSTTGTFNAIPGSAKIDNIETFNIDTATSGTVNVAITNNVTGLKTLNVNDEGTAGGTINVTTNGQPTTVSVRAALDGHTMNVTDNGATDVLAKVSLDGFGFNSQVSSDALTTLSLANSDHRVTVTNNAVGGHNLDVTVDNLTAGARLTDGSATSMSIATTGSASDLDLSINAVKTLTVSGDEGLSVNLLNSAALTAVTSTNTEGLTVESQLGTGVTFTGGDGDDSIWLGATTKAQTMGAGDDSVRVDGAFGTGGSADGGDGNDTLAMSATTAATLTATATFAGTVSNFEHLSLDALAAGDNAVVNLANMDNISNVTVNGLAAGTQVAEVQEFAVSGADVNGGQILVDGVAVTVASGATAGQVSDAIAAASADIIAANADIASITSDGAGGVTVTYLASAGNVADITLAQNPSGVSFGAVATPTAGTTEVPEVQTLQVTAAPTVSGLVSIDVNGTVVQANLINGQTVAQAAQTIHDALAAASVSGVSSVSVSGDTVTINYAGGSDPAQVTYTDTATTGATATGATTTPYVAPMAETQTVEITGGSDASGGEIVVAGARIALDPSMSIDDVGGRIVANASAILAADPGIASLSYNTADHTLTINYTLAAGNAPDISIGDNTSSGVTFGGISHNPDGVDGDPGAALEVNHFASGGTFELTNSNHGSIVLDVTNAGSSTSDIVNLHLNGASNLTNDGTLTVAHVETINITTSDTTAASDPSAASILNLQAHDATTITITGNHGVDLTGSDVSHVTTLDASGVVATGLDGGVIVPGNIGSAGAVAFSSSGTQSVSVTTGNGNDVINTFTVDATHNATVTTGDGNDTVYGGHGADTINLGAGNDIVHSSGGGDTISLGGGNDAYHLVNITDSQIAKFDTLLDFTANTFGNGPGGAAGTGAGAGANVNGDVIDIAQLLANGGSVGVTVGNFGNAADAQTYIQNQHDAGVTTGSMALDSSSGNLYMDFDHNGVIDSVVHLAGVTSLTAAAFDVA